MTWRLPPVDDRALETAAVAFGAAIREDQREADARSPGGVRPLTAWCARKAARAELLLQLAEEAGRQLEPDVALALLVATSHALGNLEAGAGPHPRARELQTRIVALARQVLRYFETPWYRAMTTVAQPADVQLVVDRIEDEWRYASGQPGSTE